MEKSGSMQKSWADVEAWCCVKYGIKECLFFSSLKLLNRCKAMTLAKFLHLLGQLNNDRKLFLQGGKALSLCFGFGTRLMVDEWVWPRPATHISNFKPPKGFPSVSRVLIFIFLSPNGCHTNRHDILGGGQRSIFHFHLTLSQLKVRKCQPECGSASPSSDFCPEVCDRCG